MGGRNNIKQIFIPYTKWECYNNGMWSKISSKAKEHEMHQEAYLFTKDHAIYGNAMKEVVFEWQNSMLNFLSNMSINRKAYLGHCAVMYKIQIPEYIVRNVWKLLTEKEQNLANKQAENTIKIWESWYINEYKNISKNGKQSAMLMAYQMKLL
jgi:hypothetical protein